jgi:hypothetical protein
MIVDVSGAADPPRPSSYRRTQIETKSGSGIMKRYVIERDIPGVGKLNP